MEGNDILATPRRSWLGRFLDGCGTLPGIGATALRCQRIRRKRYQEKFGGSQALARMREVLDHEAGREFEAALKIWVEGEARGPLPGLQGENKAESSNCRCSVVINTVDRGLELKTTLRALGEQWDSSRDELIIVLGPTKDDSEAVLEHSPVPHRLLRCPERNLAVSRNMGFEAAAGRFVAFLDDDASPAPGWLDELLAPMEQDPEVGVVAGFVLDGEGRRFLNRYVVADALGRATWFSEEAEALGEIERQGRERAFLTATGCNMAFRNDVLASAGGFDPAYRYFLEETDAVLSVTRLGYRCVAAPGSLVWHRLGDNLARKPSFEVGERLVLIRSQIHYIGKFGRGVFPTADVARCVWRRVLGDLEKIAWDCGASAERKGLCRSLQEEYLRAVACDLRLDSDCG